MLRLRKFEPSDIEELRPTAIDRSLLGQVKYCKKWAKANAESGPAYTAFKDGQMIGSAGIRLLNSNEGLLWAVFSTKMEKCVKTTMRSSRELLAVLIEEFDLKTLHAESRKGFAASQRMLEHLGFVKTNKETKTHYYYQLGM